MVHRYDFGNRFRHCRDEFRPEAAKEGRWLLWPELLEDANTYYAQGGIASVTNPDNFEKHIADTSTQEEVYVTAGW